MLRATQLSGFGGLQPPTNPRYLFDVITTLGLTGSLNCVLDAGDPASYDGSSQQWTDRSGGGNHYNRALTASSEAEDPIFNGSAGNSDANTYFGFPAGGGMFKESSSQTFQTPWHKNNGAFTILSIYNPKTSKAGDSNLFANRTAASAGDAGIVLRHMATGVLNFTHSLTTTTSETLTSTLTTTQNVFNFVAVSFDEAIPSLKVRINSGAETITATASTDTDNPSANTNPGDYIGCSTSTGSFRFEQGDKLIATAMWSQALSDANMAAIYAEMKLRITGMP